MSIVLAQLAGNRQSLETSPAVLKAPRLFCDTSEGDIYAATLVPRPSCHCSYGLISSFVLKPSWETRLESTARVCAWHVLYSSLIPSNGLLPLEGAVLFLTLSLSLCPVLLLELVICQICRLSSPAA